MTSPIPPTTKSGCWVAIIGALSVTVMIVIAILARLLFSLPVSVNTIKPSATAQRSALRLPTAPRPTAIPGPPMPQEIIFVPDKAVQGFSNCDAYGFQGVVKTDDGQYLEKIQIVIWAEDGRFLALDSTDVVGSYNIKFANEPGLRKLWIQVYRDDVPVSRPLPLEIQVDCQSGFQIYQVDWQALVTESGE